MSPLRPRLSPKKKALFAAVAVAGVAFAALLAALAAYHFGWIRLDAIESRRLARDLAAQAARPRRILIAGDSFLSWWPIDHCLNKDLKAYCDAKDIGILNTAVGGYGPLEYEERIRTMAPQFRPGLTLIFYYAGNDLADTINRADNIPRSAGPAIGLAPRQDWPARIAGLFETKAWAAAADPDKPDADNFDWQAMLDHGIDPALVQAAKDRIAHPNDIVSGYVNPYLLESARVDPDYLKDNLLIESPKAKIAKRAAERLLLKAFVDARSAKSDLCLVAIPSTLQVNSSHYDFYRRATFAMDSRLLTTTAPQQMLAALCRQADVPMVDLLPGFRAANEELYWTNDDHMNQAGHELAMKILREQFLDAWCLSHPPEKP